MSSGNQEEEEGGGRGGGRREEEGVDCFHTVYYPQSFTPHEAVYMQQSE